MTGYWSVKGERDVKPGECLAGEALAERLKLEPGMRADLAGAPCVVRGIVSTGGAEDRELLVPLETAAAISGIHGAASVIEFRAPGERVEAVRAALASRFPEADVRTIRAVAATESNVVTKVRAALFLLTRSDSCDHDALREQQLQRDGDRALEGDRDSEGAGRGGAEDCGVFRYPNPQRSRWRRRSAATWRELIAAAISGGRSSAARSAWIQAGWCFSERGGGYAGRGDGGDGNRCIAYLGDRAGRYFEGRIVAGFIELTM